MTEQDVQKQKVLASALRSLSASQKSRAQLAGKLAEKGFSGQLIFQVLNELEEKGLLNDRNLAAEVSLKYRSIKPSGKRKISFELRRKGIPDGIRDEILDSLTDEEEIQNARNAALAKWRKLSKLEPPKRKQRIADFLSRRGFHYGIVKDVVEQLEREDEIES